MAKVGIEATKAQIEKAVEVTDGSILTGENSVALKGTASGERSVAIRGTASGEQSTAINADASGDYSVAIGRATTAANSVGIGLGAKATGGQSVAIGLGAEATAARAIQLGEGTNNNGGTLQFGNYQILDSDGTIPDDRMKSTIDGTTKTVTEWLTQVINASGGKPISSITVDNQGRIKITYTDGTYTQSDRYMAAYDKTGFVRLSKYFSGSTLLPHFDMNSASTGIGRRDSARETPDGANPGSHSSIVRLQDIDYLVIWCLIDNWAYNDTQPIDIEDKAKIASLLGYMLSSDVTTALAGKQDKPTQVTLSDNSTTALSDNTEYKATNATTLTFTYPQGDFECYMTLNFADSGTITVTFPTSQYIGTLPSFANGETWEISIKNGVIVAGKVESNA